jgi:hypothetical protein
MTKAIAADSIGNIYVLMNGNGFRCFTYGVFKYSPSGDLAWVYSFEGLCYDGAKGMALGPNGVLYLTGTSIGDQPTRQFGTVKLLTFA